MTAVVTILHLAHRDDWESACSSGAYRISTRGAGLDEVGFIHCSYPDQLAAVAEFVYQGDDADLCVLVLDVEAVRASGISVIEEDAGNGEHYPHIYGPIDPALVTEVREAGFDADGHFWF